MDHTGKVLIDVSNPLDFSKGMPPSLSISNTVSQGEQVQRAFPGANEVKTLNTMTAMVQLEPMMVAQGDHHDFLSGNDPGAKEKVKELLKSRGGRTSLNWETSSRHGERR